MRKLTKKYSNSFLKNGYLIINSENNGSIEWIKNLITNTIKKKVKKFDGELNNLHKFVSIKKLNKIRMSVYDTINKNTELKKKYFSVCNNVIDELVGNELAIQKKINISFQLPKDNSSLLSLHSDVWSGDSPYEIVVWIPMVDVYRTKSMYILPQKKYRKFLNTLKKLKNKSSNQLNKTSPYAVFNFDTNYNYSKNLSFFFRLDNIFNSNYETMGVLGEASSSEVNVPIAELGDTGTGETAIGPLDPNFLSPGQPRSLFFGINASW